MTTTQPAPPGWGDGAGSGPSQINQGCAVAGDRPGAAPGKPLRPGWALAALLGAMFLGNVDVAIANVAGPSISAGLHASGGELELIVSGYTLAYAVLLVTSARLGEARGYRGMFLVGLGGFTAASLACGLAPSAPALVIARVAAGGAAALMVAQVLTGIQLSFSGRARARALGLYSVVLSAGAVAGQSLGGLLISADVLGSTWRPAFLVNVPAGVVLSCIAWRYLPTGTRRPQRLDLAGVSLFSAAMLLLVPPLVLGREAGWPAWAWLSLGTSVPAFAALWIVERNVCARGGQPLVDPRADRPTGDRLGAGVAGHGHRDLLRSAVHSRALPSAGTGQERGILRPGAGVMGGRLRYSRPYPEPATCPNARPCGPPPGSVILAAAFHGARGQPG